MTHTNVFFSNSLHPAYNKVDSFLGLHTCLYTIVVNITVFIERKIIESKKCVLIETKNFLINPGN
ncbi:MAG: hypothetical protein COU33_00485 [Candidatus Magasanikbacteria bacterium CG10_big_fil_rev_8_21_14_0_10_43_6]|uniref:Uncharacterized protein n=1 Tax=Candidatus Magasanikbacteria bacterium CG10_big_fil_rev_8_21_14_0_10_43_6 TaxID=1974650 RepID=A0A2M6W2C5_9BACT|nr:MAG: hypothetical protein COU33_00485 [Candidatus Magasanikbacteria bacterium CG10_big_fil_rev_8_21_14_0_10_43_6]